MFTLLLNLTARGIPGNRIEPTIIATRQSETGCRKGAEKCYTQVLFFYFRKAADNLGSNLSCAGGCR
jgi:hypothetical protein